MFSRTCDKERLLSNKTNSNKSSWNLKASLPQMNAAKILTALHKYTNQDLLDQ